MYPGFLVQIEQSNLENADKKNRIFLGLLTLLIKNYILKAQKVNKSIN